LIFLELTGIFIIDSRILFIVVYTTSFAHYPSGKRAAKTV